MGEHQPVCSDISGKGRIIVLHKGKKAVIFPELDLLLMDAVSIGVSAALIGELDRTGHRVLRGDQRVARKRQADLFIRKKEMKAHCPVVVFEHLLHQCERPAAASYRDLLERSALADHAVVVILHAVIEAHFSQLRAVVKSK